MSMRSKAASFASDPAWCASRARSKREQASTRSSQSGAAGEPLAADFSFAAIRSVRASRCRPTVARANVAMP